jgi:hypothetical protein
MRLLRPEFESERKDETLQQVQGHIVLSDRVSEGGVEGSQIELLPGRVGGRSEGCDDEAGLELMFLSAY